ncbi:hypothetical protein CDL12_25981 [Handroanthus impetiginosus]|uniref:Uncharacterized protein n=1 Tax=Handroanthus impetiginosus TaxID=429701 RepID=A0A2G9G882_9LAMI|nr:hypothetical protein CDL12_25981 [Handroanthus impetiginosus]
MQTNGEVAKQSSSNEKLPNTGKTATSTMEQSDNRNAVRRESYIELDNFKIRWSRAVRGDKCWVDPFHNQQPAKPK